MRSSKVLTSLAAGLLFAACASGPDLVADRAGVDKLSADFVAAMKANNVDAFMATTADDAVFSPPNEPEVSGKAALRTWNENMLKAIKTTNVVLSNRDVTFAGDVAIETGTFDWTVTLAAGGAPMTDHGRYVVHLGRQSDGSWKIKRDMWSSMAPAAPAPAPSKATKAPSKAATKAPSKATKKR